MAHGAIEWIEIPAGDPAAAAKFYESVFGWKINREARWEEYPMFMDASNNLGGGFTKQARPQPEAGILIYITVDDIEGILPKITKNGGKAAHPKTQIAPEIGYWASFSDPSGNTIGLYEKVAKS